MQVIDKKNIEKRILYYWSKLYNMSIKSGNDYNQLEKGIVILISDYELESLKEIQTNCEWLKDIDGSILRNTLDDLEKTYDRFHKLKNGSKL